MTSQVLLAKYIMGISEGNCRSIPFNWLEVPFYEKTLPREKKVRPATFSAKQVALGSVILQELFHLDTQKKILMPAKLFIRNQYYFKNN
jgi:hypothetical protein